MRKHILTILLVLLLVAGFSLLLYPTVSDAWNSKHQSRAIASYNESVMELAAKDYSATWASAQEYNVTLNQRPNRFFLSDEEREEYDALLNVSGNGIMGYVEIPKLDCKLPIYHGTDEAILQIAVGHIEGSSLPVGGAGTHCVLSGHRGLPSARLFTDLDQMAVGDVFMLHVLDETLTYQVDQILTVLPEDLSALEIDPEQDLCTLVTCTPYGINSHRLLVRGHRVENAKQAAAAVVTSDVIQIERWRVALFMAAPMVLVLMSVWLVQSRKR